jgi:hypothetical protein
MCNKTSIATGQWFSKGYVLKKSNKNIIIIIIIIKVGVVAPLGSLPLSLVTNYNAYLRGGGLTSF